MPPLLKRIYFVRIISNIPPVAKRSTLSHNLRPSTRLLCPDRSAAGPDASRMNDQGLIRNGAKFRKQFKETKKLGKGAEGRVTLWRNDLTGKCIAVKQPVESRTRKFLKKEINRMQIVGKHLHVIQMLGWDEYWLSGAPAIFYEFCELGDVQQYRDMFHNRQVDLPEMTIWKLLADMSKGLHHIHTQLQVPYVHGDFKPENILVARPPDSIPGEIPILPIFKIADISRLVPFSQTGPVQTFFGTPEYAPPQGERVGRVAPPVDIYALGATVQQFALHRLPIQTREKFVKNLQRKGENKVCIDDLKKDERWRHNIPVVWRPLNATQVDQKTLWDLTKSVPQYSDALNEWYKMCMQPQVSKRISADVLMEWYVPLAEDQIELLAVKQIREEARLRAERLKARYARKRYRILRESVTTQSRATITPKYSIDTVESPLPITAKRQS